MDTIEAGGQEWNVYTQQEADEEGIDYCFWRDVENDGDWAITDDGYVMKTRKIYNTKSGSRQVVLAGGRSWDNDRSEINYEDYKDVGNYLYNKPQKHMEREVKRPRAKMAIDLYARHRMNGTTHSNMPWDIIGNVYRPDQNIPAWRVQQLFKTKEVMAEVNKKIIEILDEQGLSDNKIAASFKELLEKSKEDEDLTNWRLTLDSVTKMRGIDKPKEKQRLIEESVNFSREINDGINTERQQIEATRKQEIDEDDDE